MTIEKLAEKAREKGLKVSLKKRSDGGYVVKSINGHKYKGVEGNKVLRAIEDERLSASQLAQRRGQYYNVNRKGLIKKRKTKTGEEVSSKVSKKLTDEVSAPLKEQLKKTQRKWTKRKLFEKGQGRFTMESVRKAIRSELKAGYTMEEAEQNVLERLKQAEKYARGFAYPDTADKIKSMIETLRRSLVNQLTPIIENKRTNPETAKYYSSLLDKLDKAINRIDINEFEDEKIKLINAILYNETMEMVEQAEAIINVLSH